MTLTIKATPAVYGSVQFDIIYTVADAVATADPVTYPNFKFVGDIYIGGVLIARIKKTPDPVTSIGIFNIGDIVRNYIVATFNPVASALIAQRLSNKQFSIAVTMQFGEEYNYTTYLNLVVDSARTFYNNYNGRLAGGTSSLTTMLDKPLTSRPTITPVKNTSLFNLIPFLPTTTNTVQLVIKSYDYSNSVVSVLNYNVIPGSANELIIINCSKAAINASLANMINDTIKYYTVFFNTPNITGLTYQFNMVCEDIFNIYTLHFLNKFGGFESKDFTKVSRKTILIEKKDFGKLAYTVDSLGVVSYYNSNNIYNESRSVYSSHYAEKMTLNSDILTDAEYVWLEELIVSPLIYLEDSGYFYPISITETNYEQKKSVNDDLTNLTINIEFGQQLNAQYR